MASAAAAATRVVRAAPVMLFVILVAAVPVGCLLTPDLLACDGGARAPGGCVQSLTHSLSVLPPLLGTSYYSQFCNMGYPCLPTDHPIADWVQISVLNGGTAQSVAMTVGLYLSPTLVTLANGRLGCDVDVTYPAAGAISVGTAAVGPLDVGEWVGVAFAPTAAVMSWSVGDAAAHGDRTALARCLIAYVNDGKTNYEAEPDSRNNIAYGVVQLVDLVDLKVETLTAGFTSLPWLAGAVLNAGVVPAPGFFVDFYALTTGRYVRHLTAWNASGAGSAALPSLACSLSDATAAHPLDGADLVYLGAVRVRDLMPGEVRPVYPHLVREPSPAAGYDTVCIGLVLDAQNQVPEPYEDGLDNFGISAVSNAGIVTCVARAAAAQRVALCSATAQHAAGQLRVRRRDHADVPTSHHPRARARAGSCTRS
jgi:hypothetical protein